VKAAAGTKLLLSAAAQSQVERKFVKFVVIFGPPAVGKMTVGHELSKITGFRLFHNHMTIELVLNFFDFGDPQFEALVSEFRQRVFE
jgi:replication-associated recombination protein RarA